MSSNLLIGILMQIIPAFTDATGVDILVIQKGEGDRYQFTQNIEKNLCNQYSNNPSCEADMRGVPYETVSGWAYKSFETNSSDIGDVCLYMIPDPTSGATYFNYIDNIKDKYSTVSKQFNTSVEYPSTENAYMYTALSTLAECARKDDESIYAQIEREMAFASLAMTLIEGDTTFIREPNANIIRRHADIINSSAAQYATNIGERILLELWKAETVKSLNRESYCGASSLNSGVLNKKSKDINTVGIPRTSGWVPTCPFDDERQSFTQRTLEVNDSNLHLFMFGASENLIRQARNSDDGAYGPMSPVVSNPPEPYSPMKPFGSYSSAISYIWQTSSNLVGN